MTRATHGRHGRVLRRTLTTLLAIAAAAAPGAAAETTYPPGFEERTLATGLARPTSIDWLPDGRALIAEQSGRVRVLRTDGSLAPQPLIDISDHVESAPSYGHRGLLGIAVDSDFASNRFLYLLYVHRPASLPPDGKKSSRLTRVVLGPGDEVGPEAVLLGTGSNGQCPPPSNDADCIPADGAFHGVGTVRSDADGTLWVGTGDAGMIPPLSNDERSFAGKLLHVDRQGRGLPGHAFCPADNDLTHVCTKLHAKGFRNPFRFTLRPDGRPLVGDVGEEDREEVDVAAAGGDYGWPCYEGSIRTPAFSGLAQCQSVYAAEGTPAAPYGPVYEHPHTAAGAAIIGGPVLTAAAFPPSYAGQLIVGDFIQGFLRRLKLGPGGEVTGTQDFAYGWSGVDLELTPSGTLAYLHYNAGQLREIRYVGRDPYAGTAGLRAHWRLGELSGTTAADTTGAHPGTYRGGVALGRPGALEEGDPSAGFDGVDDEMVAPGPPLAGEGTLEGWFRWEAGVALMRDTTASGGWILAFDQGGRVAYRAGGATYTTNLTTASLRGGWHHVVLTLAGGRTAFYVDGALVHEQTGVAAVAARPPWHVMRNGTLGQFARGSADEVAVYDAALPAATVAAHHRALVAAQQPPPLAPTGLSAFAPDGRVRLVWERNDEPVAGYAVYRAGAPGGPYVRLTGAPVTETSFTDSGLTNGTTYYYVVRAVDSFGTESANSAQRAATPAVRPYADAVLSSPGLRGYWRLGDAAGVTARNEGGASPGAYVGGVALGQPGAVPGDDSAGFDGIDDEVTVSGPGLALSGAGSLEGWFRWEAGVALMRDSSSEWALAFDNGGFVAYRAGGKTFTTSRTTASLRGRWHHVVLTVDGGATAFYVDGELVHSGSGAGALPVQLPWRVMRNGGEPQFARGGADELAIYTAALPAATVLEHFRAAAPEGPPPAPAGLTAAADDGAVVLDWADGPALVDYDVYRSLTSGGPYTRVNAARVGASAYTDTGLQNGTTYHYVVRAVDAFGSESAPSGEVSATPATGRYGEVVRATPGVRSFWRLGEPSGTTALDKVGSHAGIYRGGVALGVPGALVGPYTAAGFDGANDEMTASGPALTGAGSIEGWFLWEAGVALMRDSTASGGWILAYDTGGHVAYRAGGSTFTTALTTASMRGGWHHIVLTYGGGTTAFYVDGALVHSRTGVTAVGAALPWRVMRNGSTSQFSRGRADEVAVYDTALPAATVAEHHAAATDP